MKLTENGLIKDMPEEARKSLAEEIETAIPSFKDLPGELRTNLIDEQVIINLKLQDALSEVFNSIAPDKANDLMLAEFGESFGMKKKPETLSAVTVTFTGSPNTVIPMNTAVATEDGSMVFYTQSSAIIPLSGSINVFAESKENYKNPIPKGSVKMIQDGIPGVTCNNETAGINGVTGETNKEYRERLQIRMRSQRPSTINFAYDALYAIDYVQKRLIRFNQVSKIVNGEKINGLECVVGGGDDSLVAKAIFDSVFPEILISEPSNGESERTISAEVRINNSIFEVKYTRPKIKKLDLIIDLKVQTGSMLISNAAIIGLLRNYYENYINNEIVGVPISYFTLTNILYKGLSDNGFNENIINSLNITAKVDGVETAFNDNNKISTFFDEAYVLNNFEVNKI